MKKASALILVLILCLGMTTPAYAAPEDTTIPATLSAYSGSIGSASSYFRFSIAAGASAAKTFQTQVAHQTFRVSVKSYNYASFRLVIKDANGNQYFSPIYTGSSVINFDISSIRSNSYSVLIINCGANQLEGELAVSFIR